jgi:uncharacterized protein YfaS (alpha-2-macroglobulin family)
MSRRWLLSPISLSSWTARIFLLLSLGIVSLIITSSGGAQTTIKVDESKTRILFAPERAEVQLPFENPPGPSAKVQIHLEIVDPTDRVLARADRDEEIVGNRIVSIPLVFSVSKLSPKENHQLACMRLRYQLVDKTAATKLADGILSFSQIAPELFELRLMTSSIAQEGTNYRVRVQARNPTSSLPIAGVTISGELSLEHDSGDIQLQAYGNTDVNGYALLDFPIPSRFPQFPHETHSSGGEITVTGRRGVIVSDASNNVLVDQFARVLINTDKPIYQPGQILHTRALVFSPSRKVLVNQPVNLKIVDYDDVVVHQASLTTSRFGIVSADWQIPDNIRLGPFTVGLSLSNDAADGAASTYVRVTRYELPNFSVKVHPDRKFYLPGQDAKVEVRADYLFGRPVSRAHVKVVRESDRHWDSDGQEWVAEEGEVFEGDTDNAGAFTALVNLAEHHKALADSYESNRFDDISYAAYVTDLSTNRTEQRRFDLRVSKEPIHVYLVRANDYEDGRGRLPAQWYVTTAYADGSPAQCNVVLKVSELGEAESISVTARTNRRGLGRLPLFKLPSSWDAHNANVSITARDLRGRKGSQLADIYLQHDDKLRIQTDKVIYRAGESINAQVEANFDDGFVIVEIADEHEVFQSTRLRVVRGHASIRFPYSAKFKDKVSVAAFLDGDSFELATRTFLYPQNRDLKVGITPEKTTYRPGEEAQIALQVSGPRGSASESALGVVVMDQAVNERAHADADFGGNYTGNYESFSGSDEEIGGITLNSIRRLNLTRPIPADLSLAAEMILSGSYVYHPQFETGDRYESNDNTTFIRIISAALLPLNDALAKRYEINDEYPREETTFRRILGDANVDLDRLRDPWGVPFQHSFYVSRETDNLALTSAGADKHFGTGDDFTVEQFSWRYFKTIGQAIDRAVIEYHKRTGAFIRDKQTLIGELHRLGITDSQLIDRWGTPYDFIFGVSQNYSIVVRSAGPNRVLAQSYNYDDDFPLWTNSIDHFAEPRQRIRTALAQSTTQHPFPDNATEFAEVLRQANIDSARLLDPWNRPYVARFRLQKLFVDRVTTSSNAAAQIKTNITPVTQTLRVLTLQSSGPDGEPNTSDDFVVASFSGVVSEESATETVNTQLVKRVVVTPNTGAIAGFVTDPNGAQVTGARVTATADSKKFETLTADDGSYIISNLPPNTYQIAVDASAFKRQLITEIIVRASNITTVNVALELGAPTEYVTVTSSAPTIQTRQLSDLSINAGRGFSTLKSLKVVTKSGSNEQFFTPRLREYFPETLLWQPQLTTDKQGHAHLNFKLADNITTWKMSVFGSNENGEVGTAEAEIRAFQPFFAELDPPRVLTQGDRISLPVVLRNYLERKQIVDLELKPESWFSLLSNNRKRAEVPAGDSARQTFDIQAVASIENGKQRVTAIGSNSSDAIEKPITVHPDGEEKTETVSDILGSSTSLTVNIPDDAMANSIRSELKIYPNLMSHVWESIEGIMRRPHGCTEQTISASYPALLILKFAQENEKTSSLAMKARHNLEAGYQQLRGYQADDGGFTYWGRGDGDIALTAYALRFLNDASSVIDVDQSIVEKAETWLTKQQRPDGTWPAKYWNGDDDRQRSPLLTAHVARSLAQIAASKKSPAVQTAVHRSLDYLKERSQQIDEPYLIASYSLAASLSGQTAAAQTANEHLRSLVHSEPTGSYWALETNTPFYGWGTAGRVETTALVLQALLNEAESKESALERSALLFLLRKKDRYGVWYSTQATVNVLESMLSFLSKRRVNTEAPTSSTIELVVNGSPIKTLATPADDQMLEPQVVDLSSVVKAGNNRIELRTPANSRTASVEVVSNFYVPWTTTNETARVRSGDAEALKLETRFDRYESKVMEEITCQVKAERVGFKGYGMLLAEIGLPPGADVDRASLEAAMRGSDWAINQYDILPDRVVVYLWPSAGGTEFSFKFRPRIAMKAKATASTVYDYYNPEARAVVAPGMFVVR